MIGEIQRIYVGQSALAMDLQTNLNLVTEGAVSAVQKYIKPDGTTGEWICTIEPDGLTGIIRYTVVDDTILDQAGLWKRWAFVTFAASKKAPGDMIEFLVEIEGT